MSISNQNISTHSDDSFVPMDLVPGVLAGYIVVLIICFVGLIGNGLSGIILFRKEMRSSTSYLLLGLTFSDTLILTYTVVFVLFDLKLIPSDGKTTVGFLIFWNWFSKSGTKYFTVAVSLERYIAICHPFKVQFWLTKNRMLMYTGAVVAFAFLLATIRTILQLTFEHLELRIYAAVLLHAIPLSSVIFLNLKIYFGIQRFQNRRKSLTPAENSEVSMAKMLIVLVAVYSVCCSFSLLHLIMHYNGYVDSTYVMTILGQMVNVFNSSVNFIIYYMMLKRFRDQFGELMQSCSSRVRKGSLAKPVKEESGDHADGETSIAHFDSSPAKVTETSL